MSENIRPEQPEASEIYSEHLLTAKLSGDTGHDVLQVLATDDSVRVKVAMEKAYLCELNETRADILQRLIGKNALKFGSGWAIFEVYRPVEHTDKSPKNRNKFVLIAATTPDSSIHSGKSISPPHIRMLTKQMVATWQGDQWFTEDVTLGENGDSQYRIDTMHKYMKHRHEHATAPLFAVKVDNNLGHENFEDWTPDDVIDTSPLNIGMNTEPVIFSHRDDINDKVDALARARQILTEIYELEPRWHNTGII